MESIEILQQYTGSIYSSVIFVHIKLANIPSIASPLPCETHPAQRLSMTLV